MGRTAGIWPYVCLAPALAVFFVFEIVPAFATSIFSLTDYTGLPNTPINFEIWANLGFSMMVFLAGMQNIPSDVYEAGKLDGTGPWSAFRYLTIPLLAPSITINVLLAIIGTITGFELIFVLTDGGPAFASQTLGMWVFNQAFFISNNRLPGYAATIAMVQFVIVFAIALLAQYYLRRREAVL